MKKGLSVALCCLLLLTLAGCAPPQEEEEYPPVLMPVAITVPQTGGDAALFFEMTPPAGFTEMPADPNYEKRYAAPDYSDDSSAIHVRRSERVEGLLDFSIEEMSLQFLQQYAGEFDQTPIFTILELETIPVSSYSAVCMRFTLEREGNPRDHVFVMIDAAQTFTVSFIDDTGTGAWLDAYAAALTTVKISAVTVVQVEQVAFYLSGDWTPDPEMSAGYSYWMPDDIGCIDVLVWRNWPVITSMTEAQAALETEIGLVLDTYDYLADEGYEIRNTDVYGKNGGYFFRIDLLPPTVTADTFGLSFCMVHHNGARYTFLGVVGGLETQQGLDYCTAVYDSIVCLGGPSAG